MQRQLIQHLCAARGPAQLQQLRACLQHSARQAQAFRVGGAMQQPKRSQRLRSRCLRQRTLGCQQRCQHSAGFRLRKRMRCQPSLCHSRRHSQRHHCRFRQHLQHAAFHQPHYMRARAAARCLRCPQFRLAGPQVYQLGQQRCGCIRAPQLQLRGCQTLAAAAHRQARRLCMPHLHGGRIQQRRLACMPAAHKPLQHRPPRHARQCALQLAPAQRAAFAQQSQHAQLQRARPHSHHRLAQQLVLRVRALRQAGRQHQVHALNQVSARLTRQPVRQPQLFRAQHRLRIQQCLHRLKLRHARGRRCAHRQHHALHALFAKRHHHQMAGAHAARQRRRHTIMKRMLEGRDVGENFGVHGAPAASFCGC